MTDFKQAHPDGVMVAVDQMSVYLQARMSHVWYPVGQTPVVRIAPQRDVLLFYGALDVVSGHQIALSVPKMNADSTVHFLNHLLTCFPDRPILLLWDRAPWHKGQARQFIETHPLLDMMYFPPACPHLNPQEHVWKLTRDAVGRLRDYRHLSAMREAFQSHLDNTLFPVRWIKKYLPESMLRF